LWPDRFIAGVFPETGWLHRAGAKELNRFTVDSTDRKSVAQGLDLLLEGQRWGRRASLELLVSDSLARVIHLPWQDSVTTEEQRAAYARACFDQAGMVLDDDWLVQAAFRHFRGAGFGYALPRSLVSQVRDQLIERRMALRSIMPLSASAYWRNRCGVHGKRSALMLEEHGRVSAILFDGKRCAGMYAQPTGVGALDAARRLLRTVDAVFPSISRVQLWTLQKGGADAELIKKHLPQTSVELLEKTRWN
jgi:hypothetical protein